MDNWDILKTNEANCKDCYKCIRYCPVNAIKVHNGHAQVDPERCILDGTCYKVCPQKAKVVRNDTETVKEILKKNDYVVASIAPSFFAYYNEQERNKILSALKYLGFEKLEQTSRGADAVAFAHFEHYKRKKNLVITSSCPASVYLIEKYYPELLKYLAPVDSPMVAHYKILEKEIKRPFKVVFISPCLAKKEEAEDSPIAASLTFENLDEWLESENIDYDNLEPASFENYSKSISSLFPLLGGLLKTAGLEDSNLNTELLSINGVDNIKELLESVKIGKVKPQLVEVLACEGGCIMGPVRPKKSQKCTFYELKSNLTDSFTEAKVQTNVNISDIKLFDRNYCNKSLNLRTPTEDEITSILLSIGKTKPEDEYNCGMCGYNSCREKAAAVIYGMAEKEMCIPYMRSKAEKFSAVVLQNTPNSVVVLDNDLTIIDANPSFLRLIGVKFEEIVGKHISAITEEEEFIRSLDCPHSILESNSVYNDKKLKRIVFSIPDQKLITGIFVDITDEEANKEELMKVKKETLDRAQKVINKQMRVAQEIAGILGETTAETKILLGQLVKILHRD